MASTQITCEDYIPLRQTSPTGLSHKSADIWVARISSHLRIIDDLTQVLTREEITKGEKYRLSKDTQSFVIRRGILRMLLAKYTSGKANEIVFAVGSNKKPFLNTSVVPVHFNVSHSNDLVLIAFASSEVGIDVEMVNNTFKYNDVMGYAFSRDEISLVNSSNNPREQFFNFWTRKEAVLKATSKGLDDHLPLIPCINGSHQVDAELLGNRALTVRSFSPEDSYEASIAHLSGLEVKLIECKPEYLLSL